MKTRHLLMTATLAVGMAMTDMMMTSCAKVDNPVEELDGAPGAGGGKVAENWTYKISGNDVILTGYIGADKDTLTTLNIPLREDLKYVTYIATPYGVDFSEFKQLQTIIFNVDCQIDEMPAVKGCSTLQNIYFGNVADKLPNSIKTVKSYTFEGTAIKKIDFNQVNSVGDKVFRNCNSLDSVNIPNATVSLGEQAFANIPSKCTITLKDSLNKLTWHSVSYSPQILVICSDGAIGWCGDGGDSPQDFLYWTVKNDTLTITCPQQGIDNFPADKRVIKTHSWYDFRSKIKTLILKDVYAIGEESFRDCYNLQSVRLNGGLTSIGKRAFYNCTNLKSITIPASVTDIGYCAFYNCTSLESVNIPTSVTKITDSAFYKCTNLESVTIPEGVELIGPYAFADCYSLTSVTIPEGVLEIKGFAFDGCTSLKSVNIPASVTSIGRYAFSMCSSLTSVSIHEGVKLIDIYTFSGCSSLENITIPANVTSIGNKAFWGCTRLKEVIIEGNPTIGEDAFPDGVTVTYVKDE